MPTGAWVCPDDDALERCTLGRAELEELEVVEEHLLVCPECRQKAERLAAWLRDFRGAALNSCARLTIVHRTEAGPVYLKAEAATAGRWRAHFSGKELEGSDVFATRSAAFEYLRRSFAEMFPGHRCGAGCRVAECGAAPESSGSGAA
jgi:hypothetical protein